MEGAPSFFLFSMHRGLSSFLSFLPSSPRLRFFPPALHPRALLYLRRLLLHSREIIEALRPSWSIKGFGGRIEAGKACRWMGAGCCCPPGCLAVFSFLFQSSRKTSELGPRPPLLTPTFSFSFSLSPALHPQPPTRTLIPEANSSTSTRTTATPTGASPPATSPAPLTRTRRRRSTSRRRRRREEETPRAARWAAPQTS